ncbi:MAG: ShlB/FhaC/HecB family hemolysin secretion/activation protein [Rivularia sp. (in: Bacteria)]|nr:ShlB/FhaC/HecB family hemolysin secretion/activation protein [Rivularia sp. MS3]
MQLLKKAIIAITSIIINITFAYKAHSQSTPPEGINIPSDIPEPVEETIPEREQQPIITPTPIPPPKLQTPETPQRTKPTTPSNIRFNIKKIEVLGNTVLEDEINQLVEKYQNQNLSFADLIQLRTEITQLYIDNNYQTSGAFVVNNQLLNNGIAQIQVVEGQLESIEISGLQRLKPSYVRSRLQAASKPPLNRERLESALQLLQIDPLLQQVNAELTAGSAPGKNILQIVVQEAPAFHSGVAVANNQSPSIGSVQGNVFARHDNLLGFGDSLSVEYGLTDGLDIYSIGYSVPVNSRNGTVNLRYSNNNSEIVEDTFEDLDIRSDSETFSLSFRQPIVRKPDTEFALSVGLDLRRSQTFILDDIPFSFSEGPEDGKSRVSAIRFTQDWVKRDAKTVLAARSQFSFGIDAFNATVNDSGTDARFFSWLGQFQWVRRVSDRNVVLASINTQLTPDSLLSLERFSIGGVDTVRGYRQNQLVSDNGVLGALELRIPLTENPQTLQINPFFEMGLGWNNRSENPDPEFIAGLGLGVQWEVTEGLNARVDYGIPLVAVEEKGDTLQDNGLYFSLRYQPF